MFDFLSYDRHPLVADQFPMEYQKYYAIKEPILYAGLLSQRRMFAISSKYFAMVRGRQLTVNRMWGKQYNLDVDVVDVAISDAKCCIWLLTDKGSILQYKINTETFHTIPVHTPMVHITYWSATDAQGCTCEIVPMEVLHRRSTCRHFPVTQSGVVLILKDLNGDRTATLMDDGWISLSSNGKSERYSANLIPGDRTQLMEDLLPALAITLSDEFKHLMLGPLPSKVLLKEQLLELA